MDKEMKEDLKNLIKGLSDTLDKTDFLTSGLKAKQTEYNNTVKICRIITFVLLIVCITIILCDYFIF